jgi:outer membrane protein insertion porin family
MIVKEGRTGNAHLQLTFGGAESHSSSANVSVEGNITDTNLFGSGVRASLTGRVGADEKTVVFNITDPWLFDRPILGSVDIFHKRINYEEIRLTQPVNEKHTGTALTTGFALGPRYEMLHDTFFRFNLSLDDIRYEDRDLACTGTNASCPRFHAEIPYLTGTEKIEAEKEYNNVLTKLFTPSAFASLNIHMGQDLRNHPMHPSRGYAWLSRLQFALPSFNANTGFYKFDLDANWFTPLIGEHDLVLRLHGYFGVVTPFKCRCIPYRELFHIGGPANVRGFLFGQIGPQFAIHSKEHYMSDSIGARKAFFVNAELAFPIMQDFSMKGLVFYDGGAGWDNPFANEISAKFLRNNCFNYRHAVGIGIRLINPAPIKIDWGFKLDKRKGESPHEVHFGMSYDW